MLTIGWRQSGGYGGHDRVDCNNQGQRTYKKGEIFHDWAGIGNGKKDNSTRDDSAGGVPQR